MNAVWRKPWIVSKKLSCAPGCGRSLRTITREPSGQRRRSINFDTSATEAPSRREPSSSSAGRQLERWSETIASRISAVTGKPKLKATPKSLQDLAKR